MSTGRRRVSMWGEISELFASEVAPAALLLASGDGYYFIDASLNMNGGEYIV